MRQFCFNYKSQQDFQLNYFFEKYFAWKFLENCYISSILSIHSLLFNELLFYERKQIDENLHYKQGLSNLITLALRFDDFFSLLVLVTISLILLTFFVHETFPITLMSAFYCVTMSFLHSTIYYLFHRSIYDIIWKYKFGYSLFGNSN